MFFSFWQFWKRAKTSVKKAAFGLRRSWRAWLFRKIVICFVRENYSIVKTLIKMCFFASSSVITNFRPSASCLWIFQSRDDSNGLLKYYFHVLPRFFAELLNSLSVPASESFFESHDPAVQHGQMYRNGIGRSHPMEQKLKLTRVCLS